MEPCPVAMIIEEIAAIRRALEILDCQAGLGENATFILRTEIDALVLEAEALIVAREDTVRRPGYLRPA